MDITWYGHSCFRLAERNRISIVTDPFSEEIGLPAPRLKGDVVTISHDQPGHNNIAALKSDPHVLSAPGEYEIGDVFVTGVALHLVSENGVRPNVAYRIDFDGLTVLHLGDLAHVPDQSTIEKLTGSNEVHVLLLPVGGGSALRANEASEVVGMIEPHFIVPMHYALPGLSIELEPVDRFLKAMGITTVQEAESLKVVNSELPEQSQVIILKPQLQVQA